MKRHELKPILRLLQVATAFFVLMFLIGFGSDWRNEHVHFIHYGRNEYGTLLIPLHTSWFLFAGPVFLNALAVLMAAALSASTSQLRFHLIQPISRNLVLFRQVKTMALVLGGFAALGTLWAALQGGISFAWGLAPLKNMFMLWAIALFWGVLTLGVLHLFRIPVVMAAPAVLFVFLLVMLVFHNSDMFEVNPVYYMRLALPAHDMHAFMTTTEAQNLVLSKHLNYTITGDMKALWSFLMLGLVYGAAHLGFQKRKLF
ncbi:hypothetical protein [Deinococcus roseus]|uniref:ABC transporter permease n=1 Tax=Deinococcus roseus TaxID=392414 RepID=A0ABQ2CX73_9DEIO|nr:hypothetical protein [Deinococcus roseus]GGJ29735.1 hypothetical protein GCM10008938_14730 [Deinococcus roseus]